MKYLIDIGHPAHVYYFKNLAKMLEKEGQEVLFTIRDKDVTLEIIKHFGFAYINLGRPYRSKIGKIWGLFWFTIRLLLISFKFKPDIYMNATLNSAFVAWIMRKPHIALEDTFNKEQVLPYLLFTSVVLTGDYPHPALGKKELSYPGYQELAYLHPNRFFPNGDVLNLLGIKPKDKYVIMRFVSRDASHDIGHKGLSKEIMVKAVNEFSKFAHVFISSEKELPEEFKQYEIKIPAHMMHDAIAFASLVYGESATMVSEAAVLGIPGIYLDKIGRFYTRDQEKKYGLTYNLSESFDDQLKSIQIGSNILQNAGHNGDIKQGHLQMLKDKIDVSEFLFWFVKNFPLSQKTIKKESNFFRKFK